MLLRRRVRLRRPPRLPRVSSELEPMLLLQPALSFRMAPAWCGRQCRTFNARDEGGGCARNAASRIFGDRLPSLLG